MTQQNTDHEKELGPPLQGLVLKPAYDDLVSRMNVYQKLAAITGEVASIEKGGTNKDQGYKYIEYGAVAGALRALFGKYRVVVIPLMGHRKTAEIVSSYNKKGVYVTIQFIFRFVNADNPVDALEIPWVGEAADYGDKATNKAATGALKYCLMRTFNLSEKGEEEADSVTIDHGEASQNQPAPEPKVLTVQDLLAKISTELRRKGFSDEGQRKAVVYKIAGTERLDSSAKVKHVLDVVLSMNGNELRGYLDVEHTEEAPEVSPTADTGASSEQLVYIKKLIVGNGTPEDDVDQYVMDTFGIDDLTQMSSAQAEDILFDLTGEQSS